MKNKIFVRMIYLCILAGLLANVGLLTLHFNVITIDNELHSALMEMGNQLRMSLIPGLAAGFVVMLMAEKLSLWQACTLCLILPLCDVLFKQVLMPLFSWIFISEAFSVNVEAITFQYIILEPYSFPVFITALIFYACLKKDQIIAVLCVVWDIGWCAVMYLVPPFFPQFSMEYAGMDGGAAVKRKILYGLSYLSIILLIFLICFDWRKRANTNSPANEN